MSPCVPRRHGLLVNLHVQHSWSRDKQRETCAPQHVGVQFVEIIPLTVPALIEMARRLVYFLPPLATPNVRTTTLHPKRPQINDSRLLHTPGRNQTRKLLIKPLLTPHRNHLPLVRRDDPINICPQSHHHRRPGIQTAQPRYHPPGNLHHDINSGNIPQIKMARLRSPLRRNLLGPRR